MSFEAEIVSVAFGGKGVARVNGKVWFARGTVPEDKVLLEPLEEGDRYGEASVVRFVEKSPLRTETPPCDVFGICGGCQWQDISYEKQLEWKKSFLVSNLQRVGKISGDQSIEIFQSPSQYHYRDRIMVRVHVQDKGKITFGYFKGETRELIPISQCHLASKPINEFLKRFSSLVLEKNSRQTFRLEIQSIPSQSESCLYVTLFPAEGKNQNLNDAVEKIKAIIGVRWAGVIFDVEKCPPEVFESDLGIDFYAAPGQFHQVNLTHNKFLRRMVLEEIIKRAPKKVLDVFCGSGNLTMAVAKQLDYLEGVELNPRSIRHAKLTAEKNGISNTSWHVNDGVRHLAKLARTKTSFDLIVLDPPREGLFKGLEALMQIGPEYILYVSCDPVTLARDVGTLCKNGYEIEKITCFDFFPNTFHVESLMILKKV